MNASKPDGEQWADAVSEASEHIQGRQEAEAAAAERHHPTPKGPLLAAASAAAIAVIAWNVIVWNRPPEPLAVEEEQVHLAWFVADAVEAVEDFRAEEGRLPTASELEGLVADDVVYSEAGDGFTISIEGDGSTVSYRGDVPLDQWLANQTGGGP